VGVVNVIIPHDIVLFGFQRELTFRLFFALPLFFFAFRQPLFIQNFFISFVPALPLSRFSRNRDYIACLLAEH
jgi:hypothetical protein